VKFQFEQALDACLAQLNTGADLEVVLTDFPECADELRPALAASDWMQRLAPPPERKHVSKDLFVAVVADRRRLVERVDGLVVEVKVGVPFSELIARTAAPLQGVVCAAHAMHVDVAPMPSADAIASGKAAFMVRVAQQRAMARRPVALNAARDAGSRRSIFGGLTALPTLARRAVSSAVVLSMTAVLGVSGVIQVSHAAASSLPGEALYQVKLIGQNARMLFLFDPAARSALQSEYAQGRLADIESLVAAGRSVPAEAIEALLADSESLDGLTTTQRGMLSGLIGSIARTDAELAARLRAVVGDPINLDAMRRGTTDSPTTIPNRKPVEVQLPADEFAPAPVSEPVAEPSLPVFVPAPPANDSDAAAAAPPSAAPPVRGSEDIDDRDDVTGSANVGTSSTSASDPGDPGTSGGGEPQPDEPEPPVPPHTQPNADPETEARSIQP